MLPECLFFCIRDTLCRMQHVALNSLHTLAVVFSKQSELLHKKIVDDIGSEYLKKDTAV